MMQSMFTTEAFRSLVDKALQLCPLASEAEIVARFNSNFVGVQPARRWEALYTVINAAVCVPAADEPACAMLRRLRRSIVYEDALGRPADPYVTVLRTLADACREGSARPFEDEKAWLEAIQAAQALRVLKGDLPATNPREAVVVAAAKRLVAGGAALRVEEGRFTMDNAELIRLAHAVDRQVAAIGGLPVVHRVIAYLNRVEPLQFGRYAPGRSFGYDRTQPSFPFGYLLQLGVNTKSH